MVLLGMGEIFIHLEWHLGGAEGSNVETIGLNWNVDNFTAKTKTASSIIRKSFIGIYETYFFCAFFFPIRLIKSFIVYQQVFDFSQKKTVLSNTNLIALIQLSNIFLSYK